MTIKKKRDLPGYIARNILKNTQNPEFRQSLTQGLQEKIPKIEQLIGSMADWLFKNRQLTEMLFQSMLLPAQEVLALWVKLYRTQPLEEIIWGLAPLTKLYAEDSSILKGLLLWHEGDKEQAFTFFKDALETHEDEAALFLRILLQQNLATWGVEKIFQLLTKYSKNKTLIKELTLLKHLPIPDKNFIFALAEVAKSNRDFLSFFAEILSTTLIHLTSAVVEEIRNRLLLFSKEFKKEILPLLVQVHVQLQQFEQAGHFLSQIAKVPFKNNPLLQFHAAEILKHTGKCNQARKNLCALADHKKAYPELWAGIATSLITFDPGELSLDSFKETNQKIISCITRVLEDKNFSRYCKATDIQKFVNIALDNGEFVLAQKWISIALEHFPEDPLLLAFLAYAQAELGNKEEALEVYRQAFTLGREFLTDLRFYYQMQSHQDFLALGVETFCKHFGQSKHAALDDLTFILRVISDLYTQWEKNKEGYAWFSEKLAEQCVKDLVHTIRSSQLLLPKENHDSIRLLLQLMEQSDPIALLLHRFFPSYLEHALQGEDIPQDCKSLPLDAKDAMMALCHLQTLAFNNKSITTVLKICYNKYPYFSKILFQRMYKGSSQTLEQNFAAFTTTQDSKKTHRPGVLTIDATLVFLENAALWQEQLKTPKSAQEVITNIKAIKNHFIKLFLPCHLEELDCKALQPTADQMILALLPLADKPTKDELERLYRVGKFILKFEAEVQNVSSKSQQQLLNLLKYMCERLDCSDAPLIAKQIQEMVTDSMYHKGWDIAFLQYLLESVTTYHHSHEIFHKTQFIDLMAEIAKKPELNLTLYFLQTYKLTQEFEKLVQHSKTSPDAKFIPLVTQRETCREKLQAKLQKKKACKELTLSIQKFNAMPP